jgi:ribosomal protein S18 acetylase RimI-like enzyme
LGWHRLCNDAGVTDASELDLRRAADADADTLAALVTSAYQHYVARIGRPPSPMTEDYAQVVRQHEVWVAVRGDVIVGLIELIREPDHLLIENLAVLPSEQGRGTGSRLLGLAEERAGEYGLTELRLYTNEAMTENIAYYPRRGYVETHRGGDGGYRRVFFSKKLAG